MSFSFIQITDHHLRETADLLTFGYSTDHAFRTVLSHIAIPIVTAHLVTGALLLADLLALFWVLGPLGVRSGEARDVELNAAKSLS